MVRRAIALTLVIIECVVAAFLVTREPYKYRNAKDTSSQEEHGRVFASESDNEPNQTTHNTYQNSPSWYTAFKRPEWALVLVGIATLLVIGWQAWETRRSVGAGTVSALSAKISADALINSERAWVMVDS